MSNKLNNAHGGLTMPKMEKKGFSMPKPTPPPSCTQQSTYQITNHNNGGKKK